MLSRVVVLALLCAVGFSQKVYNCTGTTCQSTVIDCQNDVGGCQVYCESAASCNRTEVYCQEDQLCELFCNSKDSCIGLGLDVEYPTNSKGPTIYCNVQDSCSNTEFLAIPENFWEVTCRVPNACRNLNVTCSNPSSGVRPDSCAFICDSPLSCQNTVFNCETTKELCQFKCNTGQGNCVNSVVNCGSVVACETNCWDSTSCSSSTQNCQDSQVCVCLDQDNQSNCPGMNIKS